MPAFVGRRLDERRLDERRLVTVPLRRRVRHPLRAAAALFALVGRPVRLDVRRLDVRRFAAPRFAEPLRLLELRLRVAAAFFAERERFAALRLRVAAALRAAVRRLALVEVFLEPLRDARRLVVVFLPALRRRVRQAFFAAADRFAFVLLRAGDFLAADFLRVDFRCVLLLAILGFPLAVERLFFPFGGFTRTSSPSAIE